MCQLHISLWNVSWVSPETASGVNHTSSPPCLGRGGATLTAGGLGRGQEGWEAWRNYKEPEADFLTLEPGPATLGFSTTSVSFSCKSCGFQSPVLSQSLVPSTYSEEVAEAADCLPKVYTILVSSE